MLRSLFAAAFVAAASLTASAADTKYTLTGENTKLTFVGKKPDGKHEGGFAKLGGTCPIPASSGQTVRHRLNRHGDRQLNRAIHTIVLTRLRHDPATQAFSGVEAIAGRSPPFVDRLEIHFVKEPSAAWSSFNKGDEIQFTGDPINAVLLDLWRSVE